MPCYRAVFVLSALLCLQGIAFAQSTFVDDKGVVRWSESRQEVCNFGTNYAIPFSYWNQRAPIGVNYKKSIEEDVYHMSRLGLNGYRLHVWPDYITDSIGNVVFNEHLHWFDYLIYQLKKRNIKLFITPMYLSEEGNGFVSAVGGKTNCINDTANWKYQERFLAQFVSHVNPYTGMALKDDPDVIAFAITNEPSHWKRPDLVTDYINTLYAAMRGAGVKNPIFYNMTTSADYINAVLASNIQGGTFQWYPSGLTANHNQQGNFLPNVDQYHIPFDDKLLKRKCAKFIYEFSPADIGESAILYPAMARSFREAGFQFAAHFAYDPMHAAYCNIEYKTHFLNLAYTPSKAIGLKIAAEAFRKVPMNKSYGRYPNNIQFEDISLSYEKNLAELVNETQFFYSNTTGTSPAAPQKLKEIAGVGNSPIVKYNGNGAYFLDQLETGIWRLEVMPDAHWVRDPFFVPSVKRETAVCISRAHQMHIELPDLGEHFSIIGLNEGNEKKIKTEQNTFVISPGVYLLNATGLATQWNSDSKWKHIVLGEFHAPKRVPQHMYVLHKPPAEVSVGSDILLAVNVIAENEPSEVELIILGYGRGEALQMHSEDGYTYTVKIPSKYLLHPQLLRYNLSVEMGGEIRTYPAGELGDHLLKRRIYADDRTLDDGAPYCIRVVNTDAPITLFDAGRDWLSLTKPKRKNKINVYPSSIPGKSELHLTVNNLNAPEHDYTVRSYFKDVLAPRKADLGTKTHVVLYGKALTPKACPVQLAFLQNDGSAFGATVNVKPENGKYSIALKDLKPVKSVLLPRPYPKFQAYYFEPSVKPQFNLKDIESMQISIGPSIPKSQWNENIGVAIGWISLE